MTKIFRCTDLAAELSQKTKSEAERFAKIAGRKPCLAVVLVGEDPASRIYVSKKSESCRKHGLDAKDVTLAATISQAELEREIQRLNQDDGVDGILVQSPLPKPLDEKKIQFLVSPEKDADCFHPQNVGALSMDPMQALKSGIVACTPGGVMEVLAANKIETKGKRAVVVGRSNIVGKPMAALLIGADATVTICHSRTQNLKEECLRADILVAAIGKARFITGEFVKEGAVVVDVGINRIDEDGKSRVVGDVDQRSVTGRASFLTPVPFGIGPMTIAMLLRNTVRLALARTPR